jgi:hypothetical protein
LTGGAWGGDPPGLLTSMSQTDHLPIYKRSYDLCLYLEQVVRKFSRYDKYTLGTDLREGARRALKCVVRANARRDKEPELEEASGTVDALARFAG